MNCIVVNVKSIIFALIVLLGFRGDLAASEEVQRLDSTPKPNTHWEPIDAPLATVYAKSVTPDNVHAEYPRPCMVREKWLNLNGLWQLKPQTDPLHPQPMVSKSSGAPDFAPISRENRPLRFVAGNEFERQNLLPSLQKELPKKELPIPVAVPEQALEPETDELAPLTLPKAFHREEAPTPHLLTPPTQENKNSQKGGKLTHSQTIYLGQTRNSGENAQSAENLSSVDLLKKTYQEEYPYRVLVPFALESSLSGLRHHFQRFAYRRTFQIPDDWSDQDRILLHFGAVDWETAVIINGKLVGIHRGGYDPFSFDITPFVSQSDGILERDIEHELVVSVYDPTENGGTYGKQARLPLGERHISCSGIWQSVWLEPVPELFIYDYHTVPNIDRSNVLVRVFLGHKDARDLKDSRSQIVVKDLPLENEDGESDTTVEVEAFHEGKSIGKVYGGGGGAFLLPIAKEHLVLWTPETPHLYQLKIVLRKKGKIHDSVEGYFGMRKIDLARDSQGAVRIRLNNEFRFQMGVLDPGLWPDGLYTPPSDEAILREVHTIRELGFNMVRKHAKVESERWYYWCDQLGLLVWQDMPGGENASPAQKELFEQELRAMIQSRRKHPSIVAWILFHEGKGQHDTEYYADLVQRLDPSRLVNAASGWKDHKVGQIADVHKFPGPLAPIPEQFRASVLGEFGGLSLALPGHIWSKTPWGYRISTDTDDLERRYTQTMFSLHELVQKRMLSAAVYHQLTDIESESSGFITYDRRVIKIPIKMVRDLNEQCSTNQ